MTAFRFIHTSDLHLGRKFANIAEAPDGHTRGRLMEARHGAIGRLRDAARSHLAQHVFVAGDIFDTATPSQSIVRQALAAMGEDPDIHWWLLPGNHDNLNSAEPLWEAITRDAPPNVHPLIEAIPVELAPAVTLLPAPVTYRDAGQDLTEALVAMPSPEGAIRIGLAHGGIVDFTDNAANIPPDRDQTARLDYLALGDWHGRIAAGPRVHYPGTPEQDRFKHDRRGICLAVTLEGPGAVPQVVEVEVGHFLWLALALTLHPDQDAVAALHALLPKSARRDVMVQVTATGWAGLPEQAALADAAAKIAPEFAFFELRTDSLGTTYDTADLDEIDRGGALRMAANALRDESEDADVSAADRDIAAAALSRLYAYVKDEAQ